MLSKAEQEGKVKPRREIKPVNPHAFFKGVQVGVAGAVQCMVTWGQSKAPNDHTWAPVNTEFGPWVAEKCAGRKPAYFSMAAYDPTKVSRREGRLQVNVLWLKGFWIDVDCGPEKWAKALKSGNTDGLYEATHQALEGVAAFIKATGVRPTYLVESGSGGLHLHYVLTEPISRDEWQGRAKALVALAKIHGFKIDAQCTTDSARILRAPGSIHQITGKVVQAHSWGDDPMTLEQFDAFVKYDPATHDTPKARSAPTTRTLTGINADVAQEYPRYSYQQAAAKCGAMRKAAERNGRDTSEPVWFLAVVAAEKSIEGREYAHEISCGHADYDAAETDKKMDRETGGPAGCDAWAAAYGTGGPCDSCEFRGTIKNPAVRLGAIVDVSPPEQVSEITPELVVPWVAEISSRYVLVRVGSKMMVADLRTYSTSGRGIGWLDVAAFRLTFNGQFAPVENNKEKPRPIADAYLAHPQRKQYEGVIYAPGERPPSSVLNLWQGFAVEPVAGDVSLWHEVLAALVPNESERRYVLKWLAWKIQNPGGVPDTILIFKGAKGTGKNSLFDPIVLLFGRHAMLADDPELIAGRFTAHLMHLSFAVLDEAVFIGDPKQADRIKSRVTAKTMMYEQKGMDPVQGVNRCAYVMLTNHEYVWQATNDERRAVVVEVGEALRGMLDFWIQYHAWAAGDGPAALLHYLQGIDLTGFNPRVIPKGEALRKQVEQTALRNPAAAWWHQCLNEGTVRWRDGVGERTVYLADDVPTEIDRAALRLSYEQSAGARGRVSVDWAATARRLSGWVGPAGIGKTRVRNGTRREWHDVLPPLGELRAAFTTATQVQVTE